MTLGIILGGRIGYVLFYNFTQSLPALRNYLLMVPTLAILAAWALHGAISYLGGGTSGTWWRRAIGGLLAAMLKGETVERAGRCAMLAGRDNLYGADTVSGEDR